ncbi:unnamed protein product [Cyclocybe aegerita]|uniref:Uncharacterized protein n=1 Tax=Cyclocybe aegerita TaxID=1973307 RepID=A0A8S0WAG8_CYCAE|nr:unnamed protein product [Cyclocybe aegerita]
MPPTSLPHVETIDHPSWPVWFCHPYLITRGPKASYLWYCIPLQEPILRGRLEGQIFPYAEHYGISQSHVLTGMEVHRDDERWYDLLLHDLSDGYLTDRVSVGPFESNGSRSVNGGLIGVVNGRAAIYKRNGEERILEVYAVTEDSKLALEHTLHEPAEVPSEGRIFMYVSGRPASILLKCTSEAVITASMYSRYPSSVRLTRWSSNSRLIDHRTVDFARDLNLPHTQQESHIRGHTSVDSPFSKALVIGSYEHILKEDDSEPVTVIRSFDSSTLALQWVTTIPQRNSTLHFIPQRNMILALGVTRIDWESHPLARVGLMALDAATGIIHSTLMNWTAP